MAEFADPDALPPLGFISIDLDIHRPPGDPYNEKTWPFPLIREMAEGSKVSQVVSSDQYDSAFIDRFVDAGLRLAARGCVGIITSCGFLAMAQADLAARLPIPIATSSLAQLPSVLALLPPDSCVGVLTYDETKLGPKHLASFVPDSWMSRVIVRGVPPGGHLRNTIRENGAPYIHADIEAELVATAKELIKSRPEIRAVVLECTNMPPSSKAIHAGLGGKIPVYDVYTMGRWFYSGLVRQTPPGWVV
ncbi:aspartate racemase protein [Colletotrichum chrysophilum]|uniref:Aspartate racemase protein n=1 Tax=Colletotrichum chrysophilum TaxID=1836956 RepID=A0AAD9ELH1_9PEZI|nr:aspartate racemase protein [Colletotrichum chrysophilum]